MALNSGRNGLNLWFNILLPSLLPFFILSDLFIESGLVQYFGRLLEPIIKPIFRIPGQGSFPIVMSFLSGYPIGAKLTCQLRDLNIVSKLEGDRLITLASTSGPLYILGAVLTGMLAMPDLSGLMIIPHYLGVLTVGLIFSHLPRRSNYKPPKNKIPPRPKKNNKETKTDSLAKIISISVRSSIDSILLIGGFVIIYNVIIDMVLASELLKILLGVISRALNINPALMEGVFAGIIELTTGCSRIAAVKTDLIYKILAINFIIGWGGLSILSQAISFISQTDISIRIFLTSKVFHGLFSSLYTYLLYLFFYKDYIIPSSYGPIIKENIFNINTWLETFYSSSRISITICFGFVLFSLLIHNISTYKKV